MSGPQRDEHKVPVRVNFYSEWGQSVMNLFNFDAEAAETTAFDVKPCFSWEEQRLIQFALNGKGDICLCNVLKRNLVGWLPSPNLHGSWEHEATAIEDLIHLLGGDWPWSVAGRFKPSPPPLKFKGTVINV